MFICSGFEKGHCGDASIVQHLEHSPSVGKKVGGAKREIGRAHV